MNYILLKIYILVPDTHKWKVSADIKLFYDISFFSDISFWST